jgi:hypothetical protein
MLKNSIQMLGDKNWAAIAALVPGQTQKHCHNRWRCAFDPRIAMTAGRTGKWTEGEDLKLKNAVQAHSGNNWEGIVALVPGRTHKQRNMKWLAGRANGQKRKSSS